MNRQTLQDNYIHEIIDNMSDKDRTALLFDLIDNDLDKYSDNELIEEIEEYYPHVLDDLDQSLPPDLSENSY